MKTTITTLLCSAMIAAPVRESRAQVAPAICLVIVAAAAVGGVAVLIKTCSPKYFCVQDQETGDQWCRIIRTKEQLRPTLVVISGPYKDAKYCEQICPTNTLPSVSASEFITTIHIEKSYDLTNWVECAAIEGDPDMFEWSEIETNTVACYYRAWTP